MNRLMLRPYFFIMYLIVLPMAFIKPEALFSQEQSENMELTRAETSILNHIDALSKSEDVIARNEINRQLLMTLKESMEIEGAMHYPFDRLHSISDLKNEDQDFRIFTWELENELEEIRYHGVVAYLIDGNVESEILVDSSFAIEHGERLNLKAGKWYGALYYDLKEFKFKKNRHNVLLGINRNEALKKKKIIEIAEVNESLRFGKEVFNIPGQIGLKRKIYNYSVDADMSILFYESDENVIVMDHLAPLKPMYEGKEEYYAPDLSFDALTYKKGIWSYQADFDARMSKNLKDRFYDMELPEQNKLY